MSHLANFTLASTLLALLGCAGSPPPPISPPLQSGAIGRCKVSSESEIAALFERWNRALKTGESAKVLANYAPNSVLLPTLSKLPRLTPEAKVDYFEHFLHDRPSGKIDSRTIQLGCNMAVDIGLYTFTFAKTGAVAHARFTYTYVWDGQQWLISSHHSSLLPDK